MPEARDAHGQLREVPLFRFRLKNYEPIRFLEWQAFQEKVVDQTEDRSVHPDAEREGQHGQERERGRFEELAESEAEIDHKSEVGRFIRRGGRRWDRRRWPGARATSRQ